MADTDVWWFVQCDGIPGRRGGIRVRAGMLRPLESEGRGKKEIRGEEVISVRVRHVTPHQRGLGFPPKLWAKARRLTSAPPQTGRRDGRGRALGPQAGGISAQKFGRRSTPRASQGRLQRRARTCADVELDQQRQARLMRCAHTETVRSVMRDR